MESTYFSFNDAFKFSFFDFTGVGITSIISSVSSKTSNKSSVKLAITNINLYRV